MKNLNSNQLKNICAQYLDDCFRLEKKYRIGDIPLIWYFTGFFPDSNYGIFNKYIASEKQQIHSKYSFLSLMKFLYAGFKTFFKVIFFSEKSSLKRYHLPEQENLVILFCYITSTKKGVRLIDSFVGRRKKIIEQSANNGDQVLIVVDFDYSIKEDDKQHLINDIYQKTNIEDIYDIRFFGQSGKRLLGTYIRSIILLTSYLFINLFSKKSIQEASLLEEIASMNSERIWYLSHQQRGYEEFFAQVKSGMFIQTHSFLQTDRIPTYYANRAGIYTVSIADRVYTLKRPSNCINGVKYHANKESLPRVYFVKEEVSKYTLLESGIPAAKIIKYQDEVTVNIMDAGGEPAILVYLQRKKDNPYTLIEAVIQATNNIKCEIVVKLHPRFQEVQHDIKDLSQKCSNRMIILGLDSPPSKRYIAATSVFSTAGLQAIGSGIPVIWAPFLSFDSIFVSELFEHYGVCAQNIDDYKKTLKKIIKDRNQMNDIVLNSTNDNKENNKKIIDLINKNMY